MVTPFVMLITIFVLILFSWLALDSFSTKRSHIGHRYNSHYVDPSFLSPVIMINNRRIRRRRIDGYAYSEEDDIWDPDLYVDHLYDNEGILLELLDDIDEFAFRTESITEVKGYLCSDISMQSNNQNRIEVSGIAD